MIIGLGSDIIHIERIGTLFKRFGAKFEARVLTPQECSIAASFASEAKRVAYIAKRFAAKEACAKALGTGFRGGVSFQHINIIATPLHQPGLELSGKALLRLEAITPPGKTPHLHLSLSDDYPLAQAVVIISAV